VIDLIALFKMPVLLVARAGLGTLNHTALSIDALASRNIRRVTVLLSRATPATDSSLLDNADLLRRRHHVRVLGPVPYERDPLRRRRAFRRALEPLLQR
jgi:dethiobiotin synthetase